MPPEIAAKIEAGVKKTNWTIIIAAAALFVSGGSSFLYVLKVMNSIYTEIKVSTMNNVQSKNDITVLQNDQKRIEKEEGNNYADLLGRIERVREDDYKLITQNQ